MSLRMHLPVSMTAAGIVFAALHAVGASDATCFYSALGVMTLYWLGFGVFYSDGGSGSDWF